MNFLLDSFPFFSNAFAPIITNAIYKYDTKIPMQFFNFYRPFFCTFEIAFFRCIAHVRSLFFRAILHTWDRFFSVQFCTLENAFFPSHLFYYMFHKKARKNITMHIFMHNYIFLAFSIKNYLLFESRNMHFHIYSRFQQLAS